MLHKLHPVNWSAAAKNDASVASRAHVHTPTSSNKGARGYRRSTRVQLHGPHKTPRAVPAQGNIVFCNSNDDSIIGVVTAALLDDLFTVLMPTQHTQTVSLSDLSPAEEIVDTDNGTADAGGDTGHTPCAVDESATDAATPPAGDNAARNRLRGLIASIP